ncbi:CreA family protein [Neptunomonas japonica]|uniref:CreA protein n=1 Tax=Neptunomonas japonica JAMM 1380 TaxID=1441457 RepID=A0A7R6P9D2_9GAMM|nr:CreA family protein [Neptunomonas japonica]BBB29658.1 CreA protein [Neptunomonas japonica JAMM 1380]
MFKSTYLLPFFLIAPLLSGCSDNEVGNVSLGVFTTKDIKLVIVKDPVVTGVSCHIAHVEANLNFSDPSDMSIACRQTGPITLPMISAIDKSKSGEVVFKTSKSILFKSLKVRRIYDAQNKTLIYVSYSTKEIQGSHKHSLSTVPLWGNPVWDQVESTEANNEHNQPQ